MDIKINGEIELEESKKTSYILKNSGEIGDILINRDIKIANSYNENGGVKILEK